MNMNPFARSDILRRVADGLSEFNDRITFRDLPNGNFVPGRDRRIRQNGKFFQDDLTITSKLFFGNDNVVIAVKSDDGRVGKRRQGRVPEQSVTAVDRQHFVVSGGSVC